MALHSLRNFALLSQITLLLISFIVPIFVPFYWGIDFYGEFVSLTAAAFLIQRISDFPLEALAYSKENKAQFFITALFIQSCCFFIGLSLNLFFNKHIDLVLLGSLQISAISFSTVLRCKSEKLTFTYLVYFLFLYIAFLAAIPIYKHSLSWTISMANFFTLPWWLTLLSKSENESVTSDPYKVDFYDILIKFGASCFSTFFSLGIPVISNATNSELGEIRLSGTAMMLSGFLLPWPLKTLIYVFSDSKNKIDFEIKLAKYLLFIAIISDLCLLLSEKIKLIIKIDFSTSFPLIAVGLAFLVYERYCIAHFGIKSIVLPSIISTIFGSTLIIIFNYASFSSNTIDIKLSIILSAIIYWIITIIPKEKNFSSISKSVIFVFISQFLLLLLYV